MSIQINFELPPPPELCEESNVYLARVEIALINAIAEQQPGLVFPRRERLAEHFGVEPAAAGVLRYALTKKHHLGRVGTEYFTVPPWPKASPDSDGAG